MNYDDKQGWIEAVMASDLGAATKVYAYGIFKHMFGTKDDAFPGAKSINEATALATGKYYLHNQALEDAGFLEVTHRRGRSNLYRLMNPPTEGVGTHPQKGEHPPTEGVTPTPFVGTKTTKNTTRKTSMKDNKNAADAATPEESIKREPVYEDSLDTSEGSLSALEDSLDASKRKPEETYDEWQDRLWEQPPDAAERIKQ